MQAQIQHDNSRSRGFRVGWAERPGRSAHRWQRHANRRRSAPGFCRLSATANHGIDDNPMRKTAVWCVASTTAAPADLPALDWQAPTGRSGVEDARWHSGSPGCRSRRATGRRFDRRLNRNGGRPIHASGTVAQSNGRFSPAGHLTLLRYDLRGFLGPQPVVADRWRAACRRHRRDGETTTGPTYGISRGHAATRDGMLRLGGWSERADRPPGSFDADGFARAGAAQNRRHGPVGERERTSWIVGVWTWRTGIPIRHSPDRRRDDGTGFAFGHFRPMAAANILNPQFGTDRWALQPIMAGATGRRAGLGWLASTLVRWDILIAGASNTSSATGVCAGCRRSSGTSDAVGCR